MAMTKTRHNITLSPKVWRILKELKRVQGLSISEILEAAILKTVKDENYNPAYFKIMANAQPCDEKENEELTKILDGLSEEDLKIAREYEL
jgi:hypothetical protein